jgi:phosphatidylinositol alpha-mannosyltransferase
LPYYKFIIGKESWQDEKISIKFNMKVALISFHSFFEPGGVKTHILNLAKEFEKRKIEFKIAIPRRKIKENYGKNVVLLGTSLPLIWGGGASDLVFNFIPISIERFLIKEKFTILHFHNASFPSFFQILLSPLSFKTTNILTFHSDIERSNFLKNFPQLFDLFVNFCNLRLNGLIAVSKTALKYFDKFKKPKAIIPNGVDLEVFNSKNKKIEKFLDGKINLLFVGRIEERKGLIYLLRAFSILKRKYQNLRLIVAGDGPERENCEKFVRENNLNDVIFLGNVKQELPLLYATCDIFCAPSIFGESFGLVILEAMASGKPVVGFANEGYKELMKGKKGEKFLARPKDFKELAKKIEILIKNTKLREDLGKWGRKEAKKYSWEKIADKILDFYRLCQKNKNPL